MLFSVFNVVPLPTVFATPSLVRLVPLLTGEVFSTPDRIVELIAASKSNGDWLPSSLTLCLPLPRVVRVRVEVWVWSAMELSTCTDTVRLAMRLVVLVG
jgi:hypothetical protein